MKNLFKFASALCLLSISPLTSHAAGWVVQEYSSVTHTDYYGPDFCVGNADSFAESENDDLPQNPTPTNPTISKGVKAKAEGEAVGEYVNSSIFSIAYSMAYYKRRAVVVWDNNAPTFNGMSANNGDLAMHYFQYWNYSQALMSSVSFDGEEAVGGSGSTENGWRHYSPSQPNGNTVYVTWSVGAFGEVGSDSSLILISYESKGDYSLMFEAMYAF